MKGILRTLALIGIVATGAAAAQAQTTFAVGIGAPVVPVAYNGYVPPCPSVGFVWTPGYYAGSVWYPGRWIHHNDVYFANRGYYYDHDYRGDHGYRYDHFDHRGWDHGRR